MSYIVIWIDNNTFKVQQFKIKQQAFEKYNNIDKFKCILQSGKIIEALAGKKCIGYAIQKQLINFYSKKYRIIYFADNLPKQIKNIEKLDQAIKQYENLGDISKCLVSLNKIIKKNGKNLDDYNVLSELIYVNQQQKVFGMQIIKPQKIQLLKLEGKCKICLQKQAVYLQQKCSHLVYCEQCNNKTSVKVCPICNEASNTLKIKL